MSGQDFTKDPRFSDLFDMVDEVADPKKMAKIQAFKNKLARELENKEYDEESIYHVTEDDIKKLNEELPLDNYQQSVRNEFAIKKNHSKLNMIIILLVAIFFNMVGIATGYFMNRPSIPKYIFTPDHTAIKKPQPLYKIKSKEDVQHILALAKRHIQIRDIDLVQIGNYLEVNKRGLLIRKAQTLSQIKPIKNIDQYVAVGDWKIYYDFIGSVKPRLVDRIDSQEDIKIIENSSEQFFGWKGIVKIGEYIVNDVKSDPIKHTYKYHILASPQKFQFIPLFADEAK